MMRAGERVDLEAVSEAWGVSVSSVVWLVVHGWLRKLRKRGVELGPEGAALMAGLEAAGFGKVSVRAARVAYQAERAATLTDASA